VLGVDDLRPGDTALDIGANVGAFTVAYAKRVGPTGRVWAVEPHPVAVAACRAATADYPWVTVQQVAVVGSGDRVTLYGDRGDMRRSSLWAENVMQEGEAYSVPGARLRHILSAVRTPPRVIKIDAQGAEMAILRDASDVLDGLQDTVLVLEIWPAGLQAAGSSADELIDWCEAHGWTADDRTWASARQAAAGMTGHKAFDVVCRRHSSPDCRG